MAAKNQVTVLTEGLVKKLRETHEEHPRLAKAAVVAAVLATTGAALYYGHQNVFVKSPAYCLFMSKTFFGISLRYNQFKLVF
ncbi:MAG: hypothetical protein Q8P67_08775 [archaeon]|nr:hypothetical protein [archaeon]